MFLKIFSVQVYQIIYRYLFASSSAALVSRSLYQLSYTGSRCSSAKVFNALTWSWSSKSLQCTRSAAEFCGPSEPCQPGAHSITLEKLYVEEQRLYKDIKVLLVLMKCLHSLHTPFQAIVFLDDLYLFWSAAIKFYWEWKRYKRVIGGQVVHQEKSKKESKTTNHVAHSNLRDQK